MTERTRREYLRDFGIAAGGISIAGCLGDGEDGESTSNPTRTEEDTPENTPAEEETTESTETDDATEGEKTENGGENALFTHIPANAEVREVSEYDGEGIGVITNGYPVNIADTVGEQVASKYEEEGKIVPEGWVDIPLNGIREKAILGIDGFGSIELYRTDGDYSDSFDSTMSKEEVIGDFDLYVGENSMGNTVVALHNSNVLVGFGGDDTQRVRGMMDAVAKAAAGETARYQEADSYGQILDELSYEDVILGGPTPEEDSFGMGTRLDFKSDSYAIENINISQDGSISINSSEERGLNEFPVYVRF